MPRKQKLNSKVSAVPGLKIAGIGIDILDRDRMVDFLARHGRRVTERLLHPKEKSRYFSASLSATKLARFFAAKEAYFKSTGAAWLGVDGFKDIEVRAFPKGNFEVKSTRFGRSSYHATGSFFSRGRWVGAQVILWEVKNEK